MKKLFSAVFFTLLLLSLSSCMLMNTSSEDSDKVQIINSDESNLSLEFPKSWSQKNLNDLASVQMANILKEQYMIVLEESAYDFADDFTLDEYALIIMESMLEEVETSETPELNDIEINNNLNAKQFELAGVVDKIKIKYHITFVKVNGVFYQFFAWSLQSKYDEAKLVFDEILENVNFD